MEIELESCMIIVSKKIESTINEWIGKRTKLTQWRSNVTKILVASGVVREVGASGALA